MRISLLIVTLGITISAQAQWTVQSPATTADLRGVAAVGKGVAWASGTGGTVLRTEDGGYLWQRCSVPAGAAKLDFRGVQAYDANVAVVMSSGKGALSRIFKTTDGCQTWREVFVNPDEAGFFDTLAKVTEKQLYVLGDPVDGKFAMFTSRDAGETWYIADDPGLDAPKDAAAFAASNSSFARVGFTLAFGTGGAQPSVYVFSTSCDAKSGACVSAWKPAPVPVGDGSASAGIFSLAGHMAAGLSGKTVAVMVAVGGDYSKPDDGTADAAYTRDGGEHWTKAASGPHGYRSAVVYDSATGSWIAAGPSGTDVSVDEGKSWRALKPGASDAPDADQRWNAISLPFAVGPKGRIGVFEPSALQTAK